MTSGFNIISERNIFVYYQMNGKYRLKPWKNQLLFNLEFL